MTDRNDIHRLLDEAFTGVEMTADAQDLKEEVRANLVARVSELEAGGTAPADAARRAIGELGDVRELLGDAAPAGKVSGYATMARNRVRPKPAFVGRVALAAAIGVAALIVAVLGAFEVLPLPVGMIVGMIGAAATALGWVVGDSLAQETTTNHPMPSSRAGGFYLATSLTIVALGLAGLVALGRLPIWMIVFAALAGVAGIAFFAYLGATQTNRHKAWVLAIQHEHAGVGTRFEDEPETAARFGIYTLVIWVVAFATFLVLSFTVGWAWSWLALLGGLVVMMLTLARMLFGARKA